MKSGGPVDVSGTLLAERLAAQLGLLRIRSMLMALVNFSRAAGGSALTKLLEVVEQPAATELIRSRASADVTASRSAPGTVLDHDQSTKDPISWPVNELPWARISGGSSLAGAAAAVPISCRSGAYFG
jgi:hypothetical protein